MIQGKKYSLERQNVVKMYRFPANLWFQSCKPMGKVTRANLAKICVKLSLKKRQKGGGIREKMPTVAC